MSFRISIDDGCQSDMRIADLCDKYEIEAVFYWPVEWHSLALDNGYTPLNYHDAMDIASRFEIGSHGVTHRHLTKLNQFDAVQEIVGSQFMLKKMFNQPIHKFAPSRGYTTPELTDLTLRFYTQQRLTKEPGLVHVHPGSGVNGNRPWLDCVTKDTKELFLHSWELDKFNLWDELEAFLASSHR